MLLAGPEAPIELEAEVRSGILIRQGEEDRVLAHLRSSSFGGGTRTLHHREGERIRARDRHPSCSNAVYRSDPVVSNADTPALSSAAFELDGPPWEPVEEEDNPGTDLARLGSSFRHRKPLHWKSR